MTLESKKRISPGFGRILNGLEMLNLNSFTLYIYFVNDYMIYLSILKGKNLTFFFNFRTS